MLSLGINLASLALDKIGIKSEFGPIAAVTVGLMDIEGEYTFLIDPNKLEESHCDMNLTVAATETGLLYVSMDSTRPISDELILEGVQKGFNACQHILSHTTNIYFKPDIKIPPRPPTLSFTIPENHIGLIIGTKGKTIHSIREKTETRINLQQNLVTITCENTQKSLDDQQAAINMAKEIIMDIIKRLDKKEVEKKYNQLN